VLAHCFPYPAPQFGGLVVHFPSTTETAHAAADECEWVAALARETLPAGTPFKVVAEPAEHTAQWLVRQAAALVPDATVVVGATGKGMVKRALVGSVSTELAQSLTQPLVIVHPTPPPATAAHPHQT
jgi:nucleotide-binding universal stress UspA family protein